MMKTQNGVKWFLKTEVNFSDQLWSDTDQVKKIMAIGKSLCNLHCYSNTLDTVLCSFDKRWYRASRPMTQSNFLDQVNVHKWESTTTELVCQLCRICLAVIEIKVVDSDSGQQIKASLHNIPKIGAGQSRRLPVDH